MLFDLNGNTYQVKFSRTMNSDSPKPLTIADLLIKDGDEFVHLFINGLAKCNPKDKFEKSKGRKMALRNLISKLTPSRFKYELTKEDKTMIWEIYFKEHKK